MSLCLCDSTLRSPQYPMFATWSHQWLECECGLRWKRRITPYCLVFSKVCTLHSWLQTCFCSCYMNMKSFFPQTCAFAPLLLFSPAWYMAKMLPVTVLVPLRCYLLSRKESNGKVDVRNSNLNHWFLVKCHSFLFIATIRKKQTGSC